ncbi:MAG: histidine kinase dimerization/phosphoacceptor domain -containing protein [Spirochaetia bacterium]|nr:histidine kinase dimerization/phosphoacceptor domain -containing protein [Spirochaetia bacterium]
MELTTLKDMTILEQRKEQLLTTLLRAMVILGAIAYVPSIFAALREELYTLALIDTLAYIIIALAVFYPKTSYQVRLFLTVFVLLLMGGAVFIYTGTEGAGFIWLLCAVVISALFGKVVGIVFSISVSEVVMILYGIFAYHDIIDQKTTMTGLVAIAANFLLIAITLSLITYQLLKVLKEELDVREELLQFLDHRVKNNLQTIESLIAIEGGTSSDYERLSRRVSAISAANELFMADPSNPEVDLFDLIRGMLRAGIDSVEGEGKILLSPERITEIAVGLSDIIHGLTPYGPIKVALAASQISKSPGARGTVELIIQLSRLSNIPESVEDLFENELIPEEWIRLNPEKKRLALLIPSEKL